MNETTQLNEPATKKTATYGPQRAETGLRVSFNEFNSFLNCDSRVYRVLFSAFSKQITFTRRFLSAFSGPYCNPRQHNNKGFLGFCHHMPDARFHQEVPLHSSCKMVPMGGVGVGGSLPKSAPMASPASPCLACWMAAKALKISGAPLPKARNVTPWKKQAMLSRKTSE